MSKVEAETQETTTTKKELAHIKKGYRALGLAIRNYADAEIQEAAKGELVADGLSTFSETQGTALGNVLKTVCSAQRRVDSNLNIFANITKETIALPILELYEIEIKKVQELKKTQSMARVKYDAAMNDLIVIQKRNENEKLPKAQEQCVAAKRVYDEVTAEFIEATHNLEAKVQRELGLQLREYAKLQLEYYQKGVDIWQSVVRHLDQGI